MGQGVLEKTDISGLTKVSYPSTVSSCRQKDNCIIMQVSQESFVDYPCNEHLAKSNGDVLLTDKLTPLDWPALC